MAMNDTQEDFDPADYAEPEVTSEVSEDFDPADYAEPDSPSLTRGEDSYEDYKNKSEFYLSGAKEGPGAKKESSVRGIEAAKEAWNQTEDYLKPDLKPEEKLTELEDFLLKSSDEKSKADLNKVNELKLLRRKVVDENPNPEEVSRRNIFNKTKDEKTFEEAVPEIETLYQKYIGESKAETEKGAQDYMFQASGPNAFRRTGDKVIPDNYEPGTNEYDQGPGKADPWKWYEMLVEKGKKQAEKDGKTTEGDYRPSLNGRIIPKPEDYKYGPSLNPVVPLADQYTVSQAEDGAREILKNAATIGVALFDEMAGTDYAKTVNEAILSPPKAKTIGSQISRDALKQVALIYAGTKSGTSIGNRIPKYTQVIASTLSALGGVIGSTLAMNPDDPTLVAGKKALVPVLTQEAFDESNGSFSAEYLNKVYNQFVDNMVQAMPVVPAVKVTEAATGWLYKNTVDPLVNILSGSPVRAKKAIVKNQLSKVLENGVNEQSLREFADIVEKGSKGKEFLLEGAEHFKEMLLKSGKAVPEAVDNVSFPTTTMRTYAEGVKDNAPLFTTALEADRGAAIRGLPKHENMSKAPVQALESFDENFLATRGGPEGLRLPGQVASKSEMEGINTAVTEVRKLTEEQQKYSAAIEEEYLKNDQFRNFLDNFLDMSGVGKLDSMVEKDRKSAIEKITEGIANFEEFKTKIYSELPKGVPIEDPKSFRNLANRVVADRDISGDLKNWLVKKGMNGDAAMNVKDILKRNPTKNNLDSRELLTEFLPRLNREISSRIESGKSVQALIDLRNNISVTQIDKLASSNNPAAKAAAGKYVEARDWYKNDYAPFANDPTTPVGRLFHAFHEAPPGFKNNVSPSSGINPRAVNAEVLATEPGFGDKAVKISKGVSDEAPYGGDQYVRFLKRAEMPEGTLADWTSLEIGSVAQEFKRQMGEFKDLKDIDVQKLTSELEKKGGILARGNPEGIKPLNDFIRKVISHKGNLKAIEADLDDAIKAADAAQKNLDVSIAGQFLEAVPDAVAGTSKYTTYRQKGDPAAILRSVLIKPNNEGQVIDLIARIAKEPDPKIRESAMRGLQGSYFDALREIREKGGGANNINVKEVLNTAMNPNSSFYKYGDEIFKNASDLEKAELALGRQIYQEVAQIEGTKGVVGIQPPPDSFLESDAVDAYGRATVFLFGVLTREGAVSRNIGNRIIRKSQVSSNNVRALLDWFHTDPKGAAEVARMIADDLKSNVIQRRTIRTFAALFPRHQILKEWTGDGPDIQIEPEDPANVETPQDKLEKARSTPVPAGVQ